MHSGRVLRSGLRWWGRHRLLSWLVSIVQLLLPLQCLVEGFDQQSVSLFLVPSGPRRINHRRLDDNLVKSGHWKRQQKLNAEVLIVWSGCLHHPIAWVFLQLGIPTELTRHCQKCTMLSGWQNSLRTQVLHPTPPEKCVCMVATLFEVSK